MDFHERVQLAALLTIAAMCRKGGTMEKDKPTNVEVYRTFMELLAWVADDPRSIITTARVAPEK